MNTAAVLELGALMGALIAGVYADRYSRRYSIVLASGMSFLLKDVVNPLNHMILFQSYFVLGQLSNAAPRILATYSLVVR